MLSQALPLLQRPQRGSTSSSRSCYRPSGQEGYSSYYKSQGTAHCCFSRHSSEHKAGSSSSRSAGSERNAHARRGSKHKASSGSRLRWADARPAVADTRPTGSSQRAAQCSSGHSRHSRQQPLNSSSSQGAAHCCCQAPVVSSPAPWRRHWRIQPSWSGRWCGGQRRGWGRFSRPAGRPRVKCAENRRLECRRPRAQVGRVNHFLRLLLRLRLLLDQRALGGTADAVPLLPDHRRRLCTCRLRLRHGRRAWARFSRPSVRWTYWSKALYRIPVERAESCRLERVCFES